MRLAALIAALLLIPRLALASSDYVEVLTGFSHAPLEDPQPSYATIPLRVDFTTDAQPALRRIFGHAPDGIWEFQVEPFVGAVIEPHTNMEVGCAFGLKYTFDTNAALRPYLKVSTGPLYTSQPTLEEATKFNLGSQAALGLQVDVTPDSALLIEARIRHFSNASLASPNSGVDGNFLLAGWRWKVR